MKWKILLWEGIIWRYEVICYFYGKIVLLFVSSDKLCLKFKKQKFESWINHSLWHTKKEEFTNNIYENLWKKASCSWVVYISSWILLYVDKNYAQFHLFTVLSLFLAKNCAAEYCTRLFVCYNTVCMSRAVHIQYMLYMLYSMQHMLCCYIYLHRLLWTFPYCIFIDFFTSM